MTTNMIFQKTQSGRAEVESNQLELSQLQRRVLILANGQKDAVSLGKMSLCENVDEILEFLHSRGLVEMAESAPAETVAPTEKSEPKAPTTRAAREVSDDEIGAREFLCNTLRTYGNQVRITKLVKEINAVDSVETLKQLINAWYREIAESPSGMYDADNLKKRAMQMLALEESTGLR